MDLYKMLLASVIGYAIVKYVLIPGVKRKWGDEPSLLKISKAGTMGALNFVRTLLFIASLTYLIVLLLILLMSLGTGASPGALKSAVERAQGYRETLATIEKYFSGWICFCLVLILSALAYRREKRQINQRFAAQVEQEKARLQRDAQEGRWEDLPPSLEMREISSEIQKAQAAFESIGLAQPSLIGKAKEDRETLQQYIKTLRTLWHTIDFERRIKLTWETNERADGAFKRGRAFLTSKG